MNKKQLVLRVLGLFLLIGFVIVAAMGTPSNVDAGEGWTSTPESEATQELVVVNNNGNGQGQGNPNPTNTPRPTHVNNGNGGGNNTAVPQATSDDDCNGVIVDGICSNGDNNGQPNEPGGPNGNNASCTGRAHGEPNTCTATPQPPVIVVPTRTQPQATPTSPSTSISATPASSVTPRVENTPTSVNGSPTPTSPSTSMTVTPVKTGTPVVNPSATATTPSTATNTPITPSNDIVTPAARNACVIALHFIYAQGDQKDSSIAGMNYILNASGEKTDEQPYVIEMNDAVKYGDDVSADDCTAFLSAYPNPEDTTTVEVYKVGTTGGTAVQITDRPGIKKYGVELWANRVCYTAENVAGKTWIESMDVDGKNVKVEARNGDTCSHMYEEEAVFAYTSTTNDGTLVIPGFEAASIASEWTTADEADFLPTDGLVLVKVGTDHIMQRYDRESAGFKYPAALDWTFDPNGGQAASLTSEIRVCDLFVNRPTGCETIADGVEYTKILWVSNFNPFSDEFARKAKATDVIANGNDTDGLGLVDEAVVEPLSDLFNMALEGGMGWIVLLGILCMLALAGLVAIAYLVYRTIANRMKKPAPAPEIPATPIAAVSSKNNASLARPALIYILAATALVLLGMKGNKK